MLSRWFRRLAPCALLSAMPLSAGTVAAPASAPIAFTRDTAMWLATLPLGCIDKLQDPPRSRGYVYESTIALKPNFQKTRAFYGCFDWHSSVNSTWTLVKILRTYPDLAVARLIREKLNDHLSEDAIKGEVEFFKEEGNSSFERPYGWVWALRLQAELKSWDDPDAKKWAAHLTPLTDLFLERTLPYLKTLAEPMRVGTHANTAYALKLLHEYGTLNHNQALTDLVVERGRKFFGSDFGCAPNVELSGSDFFSPCLVESALMGAIMPPAEFATWLDHFMPAPDTPAFRSLLTVNMEMPGTPEELKKADMLGAKAHLVGLGVSRARAFEDIANTLPPSDARVSTYRQAGAALAQVSITSMYDASYEGTHWIATYIVDYLVSQRGGRSTVSP
ncbi:MAG TPA: DUF2891 family protein [Vicinamibacterales bacterium]|jgi:hypothetical protein